MVPYRAREVRGEKGLVFPSPLTLTFPSLHPSCRSISALLQRPHAPSKRLPNSSIPKTEQQKATSGSASTQFHWKCKVPVRVFASGKLSPPPPLPPTEEDRWKQHKQGNVLRKWGTNIYKGKCLSGLARNGADLMPSIVPRKTNGNYLCVPYVD